MCPKDNVSYLVKASADMQGEAVDPTYFRNVLMAHTGRFRKVCTQPTFHHDEKWVVLS